MSDVKTLILEVEADDQTGSLARALEAVADRCEETLQDVYKQYSPDDHDRGQEHLAGDVLELINDYLEDNDA